MELSASRIVAVPRTLSVIAGDAFGAELAAALADEAVRVVVLAGTAEDFCLGMDIASLSDSGGAVEQDVSRGVGVFADSLVLLATAVKPTVAMVAGRALGGGLGLAAACDVVVAAKSARFALPEGVFGLAPAVIAPILLERVTGATLRRLALTAEPIGAEEAVALGLADEVVEDQAIGNRVRRLCTTLSRVHPRTKSAVAASIRQFRTLTLAAAVREGVTETTRAAQSPEVATRIGRFLEGSAPWTT